MNSIVYQPVLKWKSGERGALQHLSIDSRIFIPIIELCEEYSPVDFYTELTKCHTAPVYIDTLRWDDVDRSGLATFVSYAVEHKEDIWPVLYPEDLASDDDFFLASPRSAIKLPIPEDYDSVSNSEIIDSIIDKFQGRTVDLILDAGVILSKSSANQAFRSYIETIENSGSKIDFFNSVTICLTSFPERLDIEAGNDAQFERFDVKIFKALFKRYCNSSIGKRLAYSDYGVTKFTETDLDFSKMKFGILPKVKYTTENAYVCLKGKRARKHGEVNRTFFDMAKDIVDSDYYFGKAFSYGDNVIYQKATGQDEKPGGNKQWVEYCVNHHMEVVISQLSSFPEI